MKNRINILVGLASLSLLAIGLTSCVDQQPSMQMSGSVLFEGSISGGDGGGEQVLECEVETDPGSVEFFTSRGTINLTEFAQTGGQAGPPFVSGGRHPSYVFWAALVNRLEDSTEVGAQGQGGGQGGYEGLSLNQNNIQVTGVEITFPSELNSYQGGSGASSMNRTETFSAVLESGGGGAILSFPIFTLRDVQSGGELRSFYDSVAPDQGAIVPLVAEMQIIGETFAGTKVESNRFQYPIDLCGNCPVTEFPTTSTCSFASE
ncbi:MAG: hypothetical protein ACQEVA_01900 [Myxococcota bacterium]